MTEVVVVVVMVVIMVVMVVMVVVLGTCRRHGASVVEELFASEHGVHGHGGLHSVRTHPAESNDASAHHSISARAPTHTIWLQTAYPKGFVSSPLTEIMEDMTTHSVGEVLLSGERSSKLNSKLSTSFHRYTTAWLTKPVGKWQWSTGQAIVFGFRTHQT